VTRRWWCELAWLGGPDATPGVLLEADTSGRLVTVRPGQSHPGDSHPGDSRPGDSRRGDEDADITVLAGLTLPGLVDAHSHAFHRALRGWGQVGAGSFWSWRERMYALADRVDPDRYRALATAAFAELSLGGVTTVGEFHYLHRGPDGRPYRGDPMGDAVVDAAVEAGVRLTLLDVCYLTGGIGEPLQGVQRRFGDGDVDGWAQRAGERADGPLLRVGAAVHSVRAVPPGSIGPVAAWARRRGAPLHAHLSEQAAENEQCVAAYGRSPTRLLADHGALDAAFTAVHATHLDADDVATLGGAGSAICLCPTTERDLADGIGPAQALRAAGSHLCVGSDSHAVADLFEEARAIELDERLVTGQRGGHPPEVLLAAATSGGARSLGWPDAGCLAPGAPADFCVLDLGHPRLAGAVGSDGANAASAAVYAADASVVTDVVVAGNPVVVAGRHRIGDVGRRLADAITALGEP
jgi:formiminoglutamate deiminase